MPAALARLLAALLLPLALASCVLVPGKFTSTLTINADRSFAFTYAGEVLAIDLAKDLKALDKTGAPDDDAKSERTSFQATKPAEGAADADANADTERRNAAIAQALSREQGYRRVQYLGGGRFLIDYAVRGRLDHAFVWPYNLDAEIVFPFLSVELRANGAVRVKAPAFSVEGSKQAGQMGPMGSMPGADLSTKLDGVFTLDTDAEIVSQNEEDGVQMVGGRKRITWRATPALKSAPTAVLKLNPIPAF